MTMSGAKLSSFSSKTNFCRQFGGEIWISNINLTQKLHDAFFRMQFLLLLYGQFNLKIKYGIHS